jgi:hypothetical protein
MLRRRLTGLRGIAKRRGTSMVGFYGASQQHQDYDQCARTAPCVTPSGGLRGHWRTKGCGLFDLGIRPEGGAAE